MNIITIASGSPESQRCDPPTFFYILDRMELTVLEEAVAGPGRRGPKLKELHASIRLYLWYLYCQSVDLGNPLTPNGLRRELEDPESKLDKLCGFEEGKKPTDRKTILSPNPPKGWELEVC